MSQPTRNAPMSVQVPPVVDEPGLAPLLDLASRAAVSTPGPALRERLLGRLARQRAQADGIVNARRRDLAEQPLAHGVSQTILYRAAQPSDPTKLRPGEPLCVRLIALAPGAVLDAATLHGPDAPDRPPHHREWLVMEGDAQCDGQWLSLRDYRMVPAGRPCARWASAGGALLFLRESALPAQPGDDAITVLDAEAGWPELAPGIRRRVLWQRGGQAALLYHADAGARLPHHTHGHDEECLMLQGDLFLDDVLLRPGDYQLAPAGSCHTLTETDTGVVVYAHADLEMQFIG